MFDRITISNVPTSRVARIAFSMLKPEGWAHESSDQWLAFGPAFRRDAGFTLLMIHRDDVGQALSGHPNFDHYVERELPDLEPLEVELTEDDEMCPYDLSYFRGRVDGINGRIALIGTAVAVEDVVFVLAGFSRDENFHQFRPLFRSMMSSFQPMAMGLA